MLMVELFGKDKGGDYKLWAIATTESGDLTIAHGNEFNKDGSAGKMTVKTEKIQPKNIGRANETTPEQQADLEAQGRIKKQLDKGYRHTKEELEELPVLAMLAGDANKIGHRLNYGAGVYLSDKFDGVRLVAKCVAIGVIKLESRTGQPYSIPHIERELAWMMNPGDILDGEAYLHGYVLQDITSAVKREDPEKKIASARRKAEKACGGPDYEAADLELKDALAIAELRPKLEFHVFDIVKGEDDYQNMPFSDRVIELYGYRNYRQKSSVFVKFVHHELVYSEEAMKLAHKDAVRRGYEGIMIRNACGVYESGKRSADLQKYKEFVDSEFLILDVLPAKDDGSTFLVKNDLNEETFSVTLGSMAQRAEFLANKELYIGKLITVQYQSRYKDTLLPQFPTGKAIRDYE